MTLQTGDKAPVFSMPADGGTTVSLSDYKGQVVVLYFYPKDDTSGCTKEACGFSENITQFNKADCVVIGVSKDSVASHEKFKRKYGLAFPLASDEHTNICGDYGVWKEKSMYGKTYMGIERTTFLIDGDGVIRSIWHKVKVDGHIDEVLQAVAELKKKRPKSRFSN